MKGIDHIHYRNAQYQGFKNQDTRHGFGVLLTDNAQVYVGGWKHDRIDGPYAYFAWSFSCFGNANNNQLCGFNVLVRPQQRRIIKPTEATLLIDQIYGYFKDNLLHGKAVLIDKEHAIASICNFNRGKKVGRAQQIRVGSKLQLRNFLANLFSGQCLSLKQFLREKILSMPTVEESGFCEIVSDAYRQQQNYFGYTDIQGRQEGLGFYLTKSQSVSEIGTYSQGEMSGLGRKYEQDGSFQDGVFRFGQLKGAGVVYSSKSGDHQITGKNRSSFGKGDPNGSVRRIRKQLHLRSIYFQNQFIDSAYLVQTGNNDIMLDFNGETSYLQLAKSNYNIRQQSETRTKSGLSRDNSRHRLETHHTQNRNVSPYDRVRGDFGFYEADNDAVSTHSPIKQTNEPKIRKKAIESYFAEPQQMKSGEKYLKPSKYDYGDVQTRPMQKAAIEVPGQIRQSRQALQKNDHMVQNSAYNRQNAGMQVRSKKQLAPATTHNTSTHAPNQRKKGTIAQSSSKAQILQKDTHQLVKDLEAEETRRRIDLHQIYKQAGFHTNKASHKSRS